MTKAYRLYAGYSQNDSGFYPYTRMEDIHQWLSHHGDQTLWWEVKEWTGQEWQVIDSSKKESDSMTESVNKWMAIWMVPGGHMENLGLCSHTAARHHALHRDCVWWAVLKADGNGWREVENSLDMPKPKPITLRDVLKDEAKMRVSCNQPGTAEQLKAILEGLDHHYQWNQHKRFRELVAYAHLEDNDCLKNISGAMAARDMCITTALDSPILLLSQRPSVQAVADKMTRMQDGTWGYHTKATTGDCE